MAAVLLALSAAAFPVLDRHLRAAAFLARLEGSQGWLSGYRAYPIADEPRQLDGMRARRYAAKRETSPVILLVHGVHQAGIDDPRLIRLARSMAAAGSVVWTPEFKALTQYDLLADSAHDIGRAIRAVVKAEAVEQLSVVGVSVGAGFALRAAARPALAHRVEVVLSIGGHHSLPRLLRFYANGTVRCPDGTKVAERPHPYGVQASVYQRAEPLFSPADRNDAQAALRAMLEERPEAVREAMARTSASAAAELDALRRGRPSPRAQALLRGMAAGEPSAAVSPAKHLDRLSAKVFLLHGRSDRVIPACESRWLYSELSPARATLLITDALGHARLPTHTDQLSLVHFASKFWGQVH